MKKFKLLFLSIILCLPFMFSACSNNKSITLKTPSIVNVEDGKIIFSKISNADYYTVLLNDINLIVDYKFNANVQVNDETVQFDMSTILVHGENYSIRVKANSNKHKNSSFSTNYEYQHGENVPTPLNAKIIDNNLTWENVPTASYYLVKVVTPTDKVVFDKSGNPITLENNSNISDAQLSEFVCNKNSFPIQDYVSVPGEYNFYVASVFAEGGKTTTSPYSEKQSYMHSKTLKNPSHLTLSKIDNNLFLSCVIDEFANAITIKTGNIEKTVELNNSNSSITKLADNYLNINLNLFFESFIQNNNLDLNTVKKVEVQSNLISNEHKNLLADSDFSEVQLNEEKQSFLAPTLSLEFNNDLNKFVASWTNPNIEKSNYTLILFASNGNVSKQTLSSSRNSLIIEEDFISIAIMLNENNNYKKSPLSNFVSASNTASPSSIDECVKSNNSLFWNSINNAYYIVETADDYHICSSNSMNYENRNSLTENIKITAIIEGFEHISNDFTVSNTSKLSTPEILNTTISKNTCKILVNPVDNAVGYQIYVKNNNNEFEKINVLFTNSLIDLSDYLILNDIDFNFELKIQAVGSHLSPYQNSDLSNSVIVSTSKQLSTPSFVIVNNVENPIFKIIENNNEKYILKFVGVKNASQYLIHINNHSFRINADTQNEQKIYEKDVSSYISSAGKYTIKLMAIPATAEFSESEYNINECVLKKQLNSVRALQLNQSNGNNILTFNKVTNAEKYQVRIVNMSDLDYESKLQQKGLSSTFTTTGPVEISDYLIQGGTYHFYVTALAGSNSELYFDSAESKIICNIE